MKLIIYCEECTVAKRMKEKYWPVVSFDSLTSATLHINQYGHNVKIELEEEGDDD